MGKKNRTHRKKRKYSGGKFGALMNRFGRGAGMSQKEYPNPYYQPQTPYIVDNTREDANMFNMMDATPQFKKPNISKALGTLGITQNEYLNQQMPLPPGKMSNQRNTKKNFLGFLGKSASNTMRKAASNMMPKISLPAEVVEQIKYVIDNVEELKNRNLPVDELLKEVENFVNELSQKFIAGQLTVNDIKIGLNSLLNNIEPLLVSNNLLGSNNNDVYEALEVLVKRINVEILSLLNADDENTIITLGRLMDLQGKIPKLLDLYKTALNASHINNKENILRIVQQIENKIREIQSKYSQIINNQETNKLIGIASKIPGAEGIVNMAIESQQNPMMPPMPPSRDEEMRRFQSPQPQPPPYPQMQQYQQPQYPQMSPQYQQQPLSAYQQPPPQYQQMPLPAYQPPPPPPQYPQMPQYQPPLTPYQQMSPQYQPLPPPPPQQNPLAMMMSNDSNPSPAANPLASMMGNANPMATMANAASSIANSGVGDGVGSAVSSMGSSAGKSMEVLSAQGAKSMGQVTDSVTNLIDEGGPKLIAQADRAATTANKAAEAAVAVGRTVAAGAIVADIALDQAKQQTEAVGKIATKIAEKGGETATIIMDGVNEGLKAGPALLAKGSLAAAGAVGSLGKAIGDSWTKGTERNLIINGLTGLYVKPYKDSIKEFNDIKTKETDLFDKFTKTIDAFKKTAPEDEKCNVSFKETDKDIIFGAADLPKKEDFEKDFKEIQSTEDNTNDANKGELKNKIESFLGNYKLDEINTKYGSSKLSGIINSYKKEHEKCISQKYNEEVLEFITKIKDEQKFYKDVLIKTITAITDNLEKIKTSMETEIKGIDTDINANREAAAAPAAAAVEEETSAPATVEEPQSGGGGGGGGADSGFVKETITKISEEKMKAKKDEIIKQVDEEITNLIDSFKEELKQRKENTKNVAQEFNRYKANYDKCKKDVNQEKDCLTMEEDEEINFEDIKVDDDDDDTSDEEKKLYSLEKIPELKKFCRNIYKKFHEYYDINQKFFNLKKEIYKGEIKRKLKFIQDKKAEIENIFNLLKANIKYINNLIERKKIDGITKITIPDFKGGRRSRCGGGSTRRRSREKYYLVV
jgi:hypothetical protein